MRANLLRIACAMRSVSDMETETMTTETETLLPGQPRTPEEGAAYAAALAAFDFAQALLAKTPTRDLLLDAYALTHKMHAADASKRWSDARDLRQQRDMIDAEILRRTDHGYSLRVVR